MRKDTRRLGRARFSDSLPLIIALLVALALRILLWGQLPRTGMISDEGEYLSAASWLAHGRGFAWYLDYLWTRAPLYPLFLAAHLRLFGDTLTPIYLSQTALSLANVALVYALAWRLIPTDHRPPTTDQRPLTNDQRPLTTDHQPPTNDGEPRTAGFQEPGTDDDPKTQNSKLKTQNYSIPHPSPPPALRLSPIPHPVPALAALLMALYFPFAIYTQVLLSETLYLTLLLGGFLALAGRSATEDRGSRMEDRESAILPPPSSLLPPHRMMALAGVLFGLATLTRGLTLFFLPLVALWLVLGRRPWRGGVGRALVFLACAGAVVLPWTVYNSRLFGGPVLVDTTGAFNLLLGARTAYDGGRSDAPTRDFVEELFPGHAPGAADTSCAPYPGPLSSQAARQAAMVREGLCLIATRPLAFVEKSLGEVLDLFQINYTGDERFTDGFTLGRLPAWYVVGLFLLDDTLYVLVLPLAVIGWMLARAADDEASSVVGGRWSVVGLVGLWWVFTILVAPLLFAINRFRLPLLPFAFIFAAYALVNMPRGGWRRLRSCYGAIGIALAALLAVVATAPYAYLWPANQSLPSYLGPYPSSLDDTWRALAARPLYLRTERLRRALRAGDPNEAAAALASGPVMIARSGKAVVTDTATLGRALLVGAAGRPADGVEMLPSLDRIAQARDVETAVVRGDLLRSMGDLARARAALNPTFVDAANPVRWAWDWLHPAPARRIDLAGDLDLGYIVGCYLGEGDPAAGGTFRWCSDGAQLRFPGAGTGAPQVLALNADGRGWSGFAPTVPPVRVLLGEQQAGTFTPDLAGPRVFSVTLPPTSPGADVVVTLRTATFLPGAADYLGQQGALVGQARRLGVRLDWAELRESGR